MAVVARKRKRGIVFFVATWWQGRTYFERSGTERREAERLSDRRKREVGAGTYRPPAGRSGNVTVRQYADRWLATRSNRSSDHDEYLMGVALGPEWFAALTVEAVRPRHVIQLVRELQAGGRAHKSITSAISLLSVMFRDAVIAEAIQSSPVVLPRGLLRRTYKPTEPYEADEVTRLLALPGIHGALAALAFYTGMRPGEIAGRRWRDILDASPLAALSVHSQYDDQPLKGDDGDRERPRLVPLHPELEDALRRWRDEWAMVYACDPTDDAWIIPSRRSVTSPYTRSGLLQLWHQACELAGVDPRELRATRNTFVTFARRSSPRTDVIESFTHNAKGAMIDRYNRFQWAPRCDVMGALDFAARFDEVAPRLVSGLPIRSAPRTWFYRRPCKIQPVLSLFPVMLPWVTRRGSRTLQNATRHVGASRPSARAALPRAPGPSPRADHGDPEEGTSA